MEEEKKEEGEANMESAADGGQQNATPSPYSVETICELAGHTETVEFCKFDSTGK